MLTARSIANIMLSTIYLALGASMTFDDDEKDGDDHGRLRGAVAAGVLEGNFFSEL